MSFERFPYRMTYDDRLTEEAWAIASSKRAYKESGSKWEPWKLNVVSVNIADLVSDKKHDLELTIPEEEDYDYARQRVDATLEESRFSFARLGRAKMIYCSPPYDQQYISPWSTELCASWNGMRDPLLVDEFFFLAGIPDEELSTVFHFDPVNVPQSVSYFGCFSGFAEEGRQRLTDLVGRPIAFVQRRRTGRNSGCWDLSSKEIFVPNANL